MSKEYTGGKVSYYTVRITQPLSGNDPYTAECNDIIEALSMNYAEGNAFKAIWRSCAARHLKLGKEGYKDGRYDAEKVVFFGQRMLEQAAPDVIIEYADKGSYFMISSVYENNPRAGHCWARCVVEKEGRQRDIKICIAREVYDAFNKNYRKDEGQLFRLINDKELYRLAEKAYDNQDTAPNLHP